MKFTKKDLSILIGLLLGDGYIDPKGRIGIEHGEKQKEYCIFKAKLLHSICGGSDIKVKELVRNKTSEKSKLDKFITYSFKKQSKHFIPIRNLLYLNNKKTYTKEVLDLLDPLAIALWWMDDGCLTAKYNKGYDKPHYMLRLATYVSKEELLQRADLISIHAPLIMGKGGTYHLIDDDAISLMKQNVMLVNTSRGGLIDVEALIKGLKANKFHAVALDVYEGEDENVYNDRSEDMLSNDIVARLTMFPNLILTSHQAFFTREAMQAIAAVTMENARNFNESLPYGQAEVK